MSERDDFFPRLRAFEEKYPDDFPESPTTDEQFWMGASRVLEGCDDGDRRSGLIEIRSAFDAQAARIAELEALVRDLRDPSPCDHFDHHGYCQTHGWMETDPQCPHGRAAKLLAAGSVAP